jgi:hypothetical protein
MGIELPKLLKSNQQLLFIRSGFNKNLDKVKAECAEKGRMNR